MGNKKTPLHSERKPFNLVFMIKLLSYINLWRVERSWIFTHWEKHINKILPHGGGTFIILCLLAYA